MDSDDFGGLALVILLLVVVIAGSYALMGFSRDRTTEDCKARYGQSWVGKYASHGPNFCVNTDGTVKYLQ